MKTESEHKADVLFLNGVIYTVDPAHRVLEALVVRGDRIAWVGDDMDARSWIGTQTRVIDLQGRLVLPSFVDSHCHITSGVCEVYEPDLHGIRDVPGYQKALEDFIRLHPGLTSLQAGGWSNAVFGMVGPTRQHLDAVVPSIPVLLYSEDYHNAWVNTRALELAGIDGQTPDPPEGRIERDSAGNPTGTLRETAVDLGKKAVPAYTVEQILNGLDYFQAKAHALGITTVYNPLVSRKDTNDLQALKAWESSGRMQLRVPSAVEVEPLDSLESIDELVQLREQNRDGLFHILAAKIFMDGVLEGGTAYLEEPYLNEKWERGILNWEIKKYEQMCIRLDQLGFQIHVHSIGDAATRITLDGFAAARKTNGARDSRHGITHIQLVHPRDVERFAKLGVVAVPQPYWFLVDENYKQGLLYLGAERSNRQYPMKSFYEKGVLVASASDYNVTLIPNPLVAIEMGVTRTAPQDSTGYIDPDHGTALVPAECVSVEDMIASFTINGARASFLETQIGSLEVGKKADLVVLDQNILDIEPSAIHKTRILLTLFDGKQVYQHPTFIT